MKIVVCVKQVPDSEAKVSASGDKISWGEAPLVINPFDEYAVEGALLQKEAGGGTVTAICLGPEAGREALKHALAMGADEAILISDPRLSVLDTQGAAQILAAAVKKIGDADMLLFGRQTLDDGSGITAAQTARLLGWPMLGYVGHIQVRGRHRAGVASDRGGSTKRKGAAAGGVEHCAEHRRAAISVVHGNPQSIQSDDPRLDAGGLGRFLSAAIREPRGTHHAAEPRGHMRDHKR